MTSRTYQTLQLIAEIRQDTIRYYQALAQYVGNTEFKVREPGAKDMTLELITEALGGFGDMHHVQSLLWNILENDKMIARLMEDILTWRGKDGDSHARA